MMKFFILPLLVIQSLSAETFIIGLVTLDNAVTHDRVGVYLTQENTLDNFLDTAYTAGNGSFTFPNVLEGHYNLYFFKTGYYDTLLTNIVVITPVSNIAVRLFPLVWGNISGRIINDDSKNGVADCTIRFQGKRQMSGKILDTLVVSDGDGNYSMQNLLGDYYQIIFSHPAYLAESLVYKVAGEVQNLNQELRELNPHFREGVAGGVWKKEESPFIVRSDVLIPQDSLLVIEPGAKILFDLHTALKVEGRLRAEGEENDKIIFTSRDSVNPFPGQWNGVEIMSGNDSMAFRHCIFQFAETGVRVWGRPFAAKNCQFTKNRKTGLELISNTVANLNDNLFLDNEGQGLITELGKIELTRNTFINPAATGIRSKKTQLYMFRNLFKENAVACRAESSCVLVVHNNFLYNNIGLYSNQTVRTLANNVFFKNDSSGIVSLYSSGPVSNNHFYENRHAGLENGRDTLFKKAIVLDPLFQNESAEDFTLSTNSPCLDAGLTEIEFPSAWLYQLVGSTVKPYPTEGGRIIIQGFQGTGPDIGLYEGNLIPVIEEEISLRYRVTVRDTIGGRWVKKNVYWVIANTTVAKESTLIIESGTQILFQGKDITFICNGQIQAVGSEKQRIQFIYADSLDTLHRPAIFVFPSRDTSFFSYCDFSYLTYGIVSVNASPTIRHCRFYKNSQAGIYNNTSNPWIEDCEFNTCLNGVYNIKSAPRLHNNIFKYTKLYAVRDIVSASLLYKNILIENNTALLAENSYSQLINNTISFNKDGLVVNATALSMSNNIISHHSGHGIKITGDYFQVSRNCFYQNSQENLWNGLSVTFDNNIYNDPAFLSEDSINIGLAAGSPCIAGGLLDVPLPEFQKIIYYFSDEKNYFLDTVASPANIFKVDNISAGEEKPAVGALKFGEKIPARIRGITGKNETLSIRMTNFPNPFQTRTTVQVELNRTETEKKDKLKLEIFDLQGRIVQRLIISGDALQNPLVYQTDWNGTNIQGKRVGSGIYFIYAQIGDVAKRIPLLILK